MATRAALQPITPAHPRALTPSKRKHIERRIEELIAVLDHADPDPDLEPSLAGTSGFDLEGDDADKEPDLGWTAEMNQDRALKSCLSDGWNIDGEPSLGSCETVDQRGWSQGGRHDLEADYLDAMAARARFADDEPECEDEGAQHNDCEPDSPAFELV